MQCFFLVFFFSAREKERNGDDGEQARANRAATYISLALVGALAVCLPRFFEVHLNKESLFNQQISGGSS